MGPSVLDRVRPAGASTVPAARSLGLPPVPDDQTDLLEQDLARVASEMSDT